MYFFQNIFELIAHVGLDYEFQNQTSNFTVYFDSWCDRQQGNNKYVCTVVWIDKVAYARKHILYGMQGEALSIIRNRPNSIIY